MLYTREIKKLPAYKRLLRQFKKKGYTRGIEHWESMSISAGTAGYYINKLGYGKISIKDIPSNLLKEVILYSASGCEKGVYDYIEQHPSQFDRKFWKDATSADHYNIEFEEHNIFDIMPDEYLDEEMAMCAMLAAIDNYTMRSRQRGSCDGWFYSVHRRKPEILTREMYILGARCFAERNWDENKFLSITPEKYRTPEYWLALCLCNASSVMVDVPAEILTADFLMGIYRTDNRTLNGFTEEALEKEVSYEGQTVKMWQAAVTHSGDSIKYIPLNEERIAFFLSKYDKDSSEYEYAFKNNYKAYLREQNNTPAPSSPDVLTASMLTLNSIMSGKSVDDAIDESSETVRSMRKNQTFLPINSKVRVPDKYCKIYDKEEYLLEIYKKLGIEVMREADCFYYSVKLPDTLTIDEDEFGYRYVKEGDKALLRFCDVGPLYDRDVDVIEIYTSL